MTSQPTARRLARWPRSAQFLKLESASGILLVLAGALAMVAANTLLAGGYEALLATPFKIQLGEFALDKPLVRLDQRPADGDLLPAGRPRDQARGRDGRALGRRQGGAACDRRGRRHGRAGRDLRLAQLGRPGRDPRLGDPVGHRHRVRARRAVAVRRAGAGGPEDLPDDARRARRPRRHRHHRALLHQRPVGAGAAARRHSRSSACSR